MLSATLFLVTLNGEYCNAYRKFKRLNYEQKYFFNKRYLKTIYQIMLASINVSARYAVKNDQVKSDRKCIRDKCTLKVSNSVSDVFLHILCAIN